MRSKVFLSRMKVIRFTVIIFFNQGRKYMLAILEAHLICPQKHSRQVGMASLEEKICL